MIETPGWLSRAWQRLRSPRTAGGPVIGLALGGGFARGIAHVGVLRVLQQHGIPVHRIAGVSAGAMVAAAFASGTPVGEIEEIARNMRFSDVARWTVSRLGLAGSERMATFLKRLLKVFTFEEMTVPVAVVASDLNTGRPVVFRDRGDVIGPVRASCSYPGLFLPLRMGGHFLVDGAISMEIPARPLVEMGATHVISVAIAAAKTFNPQSMFSVVNRSIQILQQRTGGEWRRYSRVTIAPDVGSLQWDSFLSSRQLIRAGEEAALEVLPKIRSWFGGAPVAESDPSRQAPARAVPVVPIAPTASHPL